MQDAINARPFYRNLLELLVCCANASNQILEVTLIVSNETDLLANCSRPTISNTVFTKCYFRVTLWALYLKSIRYVCRWFQYHDGIYFCVKNLWNTKMKRSLSVWCWQVPAFTICLESNKRNISIHRISIVP